ncbi:Glucan endo-1 [Psidium guajava]|nr:Glucan endo-1 [Psidium guajava]
MCSAVRLTNTPLVIEIPIDGTIKALQEVSNTFQAFYEMSWLKVIPPKTDQYTSGVRSSQLQQLVEIASYKTGKLPVR